MTRDGHGATAPSPLSRACNARPAFRGSRCREKGWLGQKPKHMRRADGLVAKGDIPAEILRRLRALASGRLATLPNILGDRGREQFHLCLPVYY